jgi:hypothetical protein
LSFVRFMAVAANSMNRIGSLSMSVVIGGSCTLSR